MNASQRKTVQGWINELEPFADAEDMDVTKAKDICESISIAIGEMASDERDKFDNMSEGLQNSEKGQAIADAADALESAESDIADLSDMDAEEIADAIGDCIGNLELVL